MDYMKYELKKAVIFIESFAALMLVGLWSYLMGFKKRAKRRQEKRLIRHCRLNKIILKVKKETKYEND